MRYASYPTAGTLGGVGLGEIAYPSWIPTSTHNTGAGLTAWKSQVAFAQGLYDIWHWNSTTAQQKPNDPNVANWLAIASRYATYLTPNIAMNSGDPKFWTATPERLADYADITKQAQHHGFTSKTTFTPGAFVSKIPVVGDAVKIVGEAAAAPFKIVAAVASGERLDHVALGALKDQLKVVKDVAPYAATVVSLVPGIGSGVAAAIGMGAALAEGQSITNAAKAAIRSAIPGGPLVQAGFDLATKVAQGENVGQAALETARAQLPAEAQKAFDIGLAVASGEKLQTALANGLMSIAPGELQNILAAGQKAVGSVPGLASALKSVTPGAATEGFNMAAGLLSHAGINEKALIAARSQLPPDVVQGFDAALKTQIPHTAWLANVVAAPAAGAAPAPLEPPKKIVRAAPAAPAGALEPPKRAGHYAPYPKTGVGEPPTSEAQSPTHTATEVRSPTSTSTEVRSPTSTSTEAYTQGNMTVTVTGGAGAGATNVEIQAPPLNRENVANSKGAPKTAQENKNINAPRPAGPTAQENSSVNAPRAGALSGASYAPYPKKMGALSGPPPSCRTLGAPIANMSHGMRNAGLAAVNGTGGRSRMVHGPDGNDYLFALEGGILTARQCNQ